MHAHNWVVHRVPLHGTFTCRWLETFSNGVDCHRPPKLLDHKGSHTHLFVLLCHTPNRTSPAHHWRFAAQCPGYHCPITCLSIWTKLTDSGILICVIISQSWFFICEDILIKHVSPWTWKWNFDPLKDWQTVMKISSTFLVGFKYWVYAKI